MSPSTGIFGESCAYVTNTHERQGATDAGATHRGGNFGPLSVQRGDDDPDHEMGVDKERAVLLSMRFAVSLARLIGIPCSSYLIPVCAEVQQYQCVYVCAGRYA